MWKARQKYSARICYSWVLETPITLGVAGRMPCPGPLPLKLQGVCPLPGLWQVCMLSLWGHSFSELRQALQGHWNLDPAVPNSAALRPQGAGYQTLWLTFVASMSQGPWWSAFTNSQDATCRGLDLGAQEKVENLCSNELNFTQSMTWCHTLWAAWGRVVFLITLLCLCVFSKPSKSAPSTARTSHSRPRPRGRHSPKKGCSVSEMQWPQQCPQTCLSFSISLIV